MTLLFNLYQMIEYRTLTQLVLLILTQILSNCFRLHYTYRNYTPGCKINSRSVNKVNNGYSPHEGLADRTKLTSGCRLLFSLELHVYIQQNPKNLLCSQFARLAPDHSSYSTKYHMSGTQTTREQSTITLFERILQRRYIYTVQVQILAITSGAPASVLPQRLDLGYGSYVSTCKCEHKTMRTAVRQP